MRFRPLAALVFTLVPWTTHASTPSGGPVATPLTVAAAYTQCAAHPRARITASVRGWFQPVILSYKRTEGGLFDSNHVPSPYHPWFNNPQRFHAIRANITTHASIGTGWLTFAGRLDCSSMQLQVSRDPFPIPHLHAVYRMRASGTSATTSVTAAGVRLTLTVPRTTEPQGALAQVRLTIRNVSKRDVTYMTNGVSPPGYYTPLVEVLAGGKVAFPPFMPYWPALPGPAPAPVTLHPGKSISASPYVRIAGSKIRATLRLVLHPVPAVTQTNIPITTRSIKLHLTVEQAPVLTLHGAGDHLSVQVQRPDLDTGPMYFLSYVDCGFPSSDLRVWETATAPLTPGCSPVKAWHLRVAWLNHPMAALDYTPTTSPHASVAMRRGLMERSRSLAVLPNHVRSVTSTAHGIRLRLSVPRSSYPRNALVPITTTFTNITNRPLSEAPMVVGWCSRVQVLAEAVSASGVSLSPLPPPTVGTPSCAAPRIFTLVPGKSIVQHSYVALLSRRLQAWTQVNREPHQRGFWGAELKTPVLTVRRTPSRPLKISLVDVPEIAALVSRPAGARGNPFYMEWSTCGAVPVYFWSRAARNPIPAPCAGAHDWHLAAGWPGYPIGTL